MGTLSDLWHTIQISMNEPLSQKLIKTFHYEMKSGVFEDRANGYAIGDYKQRPNMIGTYQTVKPEQVEEEIEKLLEWYYDQPAEIAVLAE